MSPSSQSPPIPQSPTDIEGNEQASNSVVSPVTKHSPTLPQYTPSSPQDRPEQMTPRVASSVNERSPTSPPGTTPSLKKDHGSTNSSDGSPRLKLRLKFTLDKAAPRTPNNDGPTMPISVDTNSTPPSSSGSGLKIKLRCIQAALREPLPNILGASSASDDTPLSGSRSNSIIGHKRTSDELVAHDEDDTDSEIEIFPSKFLIKKANKHVKKKNTESHSPRKTKKTKITHHAAAHDEDDTMFDAGDEDESPAEDAGPQLSLVAPVMKRNQRILNPNKHEHAMLVASATKVGPEYYDSDADDLPGDLKDTNKPHLFRKVKWGAYATDYSNDAEFSTEPEFTQFIPGRFELQPDGTVSDQKAKLIIKLTDKSGRKRIFANPPPRDWQNQEAITALNKRTVQQIRRNTNVRFREVVRAYVPEERRWILANLTAGKPSQGWKVFVEEFNKHFEGKTVQGVRGPRPFRSHSSLTKEVERFGSQYYGKGLVPAPAKKGKKE